MSNSVDEAIERLSGRALLTGRLDWDEFDVICQHITAQQQRIEALEAAISWALGANGEFRLRQEGEGAFWWRKELQERAGLRWNGERFEALNEATRIAQETGQYD